MSAIDVLAQALFEVSNAPMRTPAFSELPEVAQDGWREQAEVIAGRMLEAEPVAPEPVFFTMPEPGSLDEAVAVVLMAADTLNATGTAAIDATDWRDAVRHLMRLREATDHIGVVVALLTKHVYLAGEHGDQDVEGVGRVKIMRARDRKQWDARGAVFAYLDARLTGMEGEIPDPTDVADWVMEVLPATASTSCKVTPLKNVGLDPKAFCEDTPGPIQVQLPPR